MSKTKIWLEQHMERVASLEEIMYNDDLTVEVRMKACVELTEIFLSDPTKATVYLSDAKDMLDTKRQLPGNEYCITV